MMGGMIATGRAQRTLGLVLVTLIAAAPATRPATGPTTTTASLSLEHLAASKALAAEFAERLKRSRYMEAGEGTPVTIAGWENFPTRRYTYTVKDKDGTAKSADVVLLDPSAEQIARWIVSALVEVRGSYDADAGRKIFQHILAQSGGQFPVRGIVYEDILPADGKNEIFCFRDGVTVAIEGVPQRGTEPLTDVQRKASLEGAATRVYRFARIQSTSPEMWIAAGGPKDVLGPDGKPTPVWLDEVRRAYQAAWMSDRNPLLTAWLRQSGE